MGADGGLFNTYVTVITAGRELPTCGCGCADELAALRAEVERLTAGVAERPLMGQWRERLTTVPGHVLPRSVTRNIL